MSLAATTSQLELLRAKLALAIGPLDVNLAYPHVKATRPDALDEPWSADMSGPFKYIVFDNKAFVLEEVANAEVASRLVNRCPAIDAGENIKLYLNDVWQLDIFRMIGLELEVIRDPVSGQLPLGSLYRSLVTSVDRYILKKEGVDGDGADDDEGDADGDSQETIIADGNRNEVTVIADRDRNEVTMIAYVDRNGNGNGHVDGEVETVSTSADGHEGDEEANEVVEAVKRMGLDEEGEESNGHVDATVATEG